MDTSGTTWGGALVPRAPVADDAVDRCTISPVCRGKHVHGGLLVKEGCAVGDVRYRTGVYLGLYRARLVLNEGDAVRRGVLAASQWAAREPSVHIERLEAFDELLDSLPLSRRSGAIEIRLLLSLPRGNR